MPVIFMIGMIFGWFLNYELDNDVTTLSQKNFQGGYKFTNPLLDCELGSKLSQYNINFDNDLDKLAADLEQDKEIHQIAVYYRDLYGGPSFGYNEDLEFYPASLLKVPLLIAYSEELERTPNLLKQKILYKEKILDLSQEFAPVDEIVPGKEYTVEELLGRMIIGSDNNAYALLLNNLPIEKFIKVYSDLGLKTPLSDEYKISAKHYSSFFRILFNSSYLEEDISESVLKLLSDTNFKNGLVAGVPSNMLVSHKFGERQENGVSTISDCGIVYHPYKPYIICTMANGTNSGDLLKSIEKISQFVYDRVSENINK